MPTNLATVVRSRSGPRSFSAYVTAAVKRQIELENLAELVAAAEAKHGPITAAEMDQVRAELAQARAEQGIPASGVPVGPAA